MNTPVAFGETSGNEVALRPVYTGTGAIFVALKLQLQNRTCEPGATFSAICETCSKLDAALARQKLHRVAATKIACVNGP